MMNCYQFGVMRYHLIRQLDVSVRNLRKVKYTFVTGVGRKLQEQKKQLEM